MSSGRCDLQVKRVVKKIVDDVVKELGDPAAATPSLETEQQTLDSEHRRSSRSRKEPDRLDRQPRPVRLDKTVNVKKSAPSKKTTTGNSFNYEFVMAPAPSTIHGILKPARPPVPPRKDSLIVAAGKTIVKKYRKVRILRRLKCKVIPPLDGWRPDRSRMPEIDPDEEEQKRLDEKAEREEKEAAEEKKKRKKRMSMGLPPYEPSSDSEEDIPRPPSPDLIYHAFIKAGNSDSDEVLSDDGEEMEEHRNPIGPAHPPGMFGESLASFSFEDDDEPPGPSIDSNNRQGRRSVHIQPVEEEKTKAEAKGERRKSKVYPVTPMKESSSRETKPDENTDKSMRRRSGMVRNVPAKKEEEEAASSSTNSFNEDPCRSEEQRKADEAQKMETTKVSEWLKRKDTADAMAGAGDTGGNPYDDTERPEISMAERMRRRRISQMEMPKGFGEKPHRPQIPPGTDEHKALFSEKSTEGTLPVETSKSDEIGRKGRRSMKMQQEKENEKVESKSKRRSKSEEKPKAHPFFSKFAPNPPLPAVSTVLPDKEGGKEEKKIAKQARRTIVWEKKTIIDKDEMKRLEDLKMKIDETNRLNGKEGGREKAAGESSLPGNTTTSISRSSEIAAAAGVVHVGREEKKETEGEGEGNDKKEEVVEKTSRLLTLALKPTQSVVSTVLIDKEDKKKEVEKKKKVKEGGIPRRSVSEGKAKHRRSERILVPSEEEQIRYWKEVAEKERKEGKVLKDLAISVHSPAGQASNDDTIPPHMLPPGNTTTYIWRSSEIDAAPYAGLVHVGREEKKETEGDDEKEEVEEKTSRPRVKLPTLSSYSIPSSLRSEDPVAIVSVFDGERKESLSCGDATIEVDTAATWPKNIRPNRVEDCLGDTEMLSNGKKWLQRWKKRLDAFCVEDHNAIKAPKAKRKKRMGGAYSDESEQEDSDPDYEMTEEDDRLPNPLVLSGPIGCGKSAYIRALSEEIGFSILESSPDEKRTGSSLRTKLIGAVANYRLSSKPLGGIASFFSKKTEGEEKKKGRQHTLVVIEHVDVVFAEEDKLFWPALAEILTTAKIPIVLICNVVPNELSRILRQVEVGGVEPMEMRMERPEERMMTDYVMASLTGPCGRPLSSTVVPAIVTRARQDIRAALRDTHWVAVAASISQADLVESSMRRVDEPTMWDTVASQTFAWTDECERRAERMSDNELTRAAEWPVRGGMPAEEYSRLCMQIDKIDQDAYRTEKGRADRMMEMARSGLTAGSGGRSGLLTRGEIAMDWMPVLECIDRNEQEKKKTNGRRHQHYFNVIKDMDTGVSIDPLDLIKGACPFFRLPLSDNVQ